MQMSMFDTLNRQQQPYIQSGYGAMSRINTLLGLGNGAISPTNIGRPQKSPISDVSGYAPTPTGGINQRIPSPVDQGPTAQVMPNQSIRLRQLLALRAQNGDTEAQRMLGSV